MSSSQDKIIDRLRERRQIEADLRHMLTAPSELDFRRRAEALASLGSQVIPAIVGNLDRADSRLVTAMGTVAAHLEPGDAGQLRQALRWAVRQPQRTDQGRMAAVTILEQFLGEAPDGDLRASLPNTWMADASYLQQVLAGAESDPVGLVEYVQALDRQEPDLALAAVRALRSMEGARPVELLRMMGQDVRDEIAAAALEALGTMRLPEAAVALQTLVPTCSPDLRPLALRSLRKLQFVGVQVPPLAPVPPEWRALVSPVDGLGQQTVWFVQENRWTAQARFLNVLLSDRAGAVQAVGHKRVSSLWLPPRRPVGYLHDVALPERSGGLLMLEAPFDLGRRLVVEALAHNRETQIPVAGVLRLLGPWLWACAGASSLPGRTLPQLQPGEEGLGAISDRLLAHPAFATWTVRSELAAHAAEEACCRSGWDRELWVRRLAGELLADDQIVALLHRRLVAMSEWLLLAGDDEASRLALAAAQAMIGPTRQAVPFVQALVRRDLPALAGGPEGLALQDRTSA